MGPKVDAVAADSALPPRADVVVVGGGIIGVSAAFYLAQKGISVALCEKGHDLASIPQALLGFEFRQA